MKSFSNYLEFRKVKIEDLAIHFSDKMSYEVLGLCSIQSKVIDHFWYKEVINQPTIYLNAYYWVYAKESNVDREELLLHELGHCVLDLKHTDGDYIMNPKHLTKAHYQAHREKLINGLFSSVSSKEKKAIVKASLIPEIYDQEEEVFEYKDDGLKEEIMIKDIPELKALMN